MSHPSIEPTRSVPLELQLVMIQGQLSKLEKTVEEIGAQFITPPNHPTNPGILQRLGSLEALLEQLQTRTPLPRIHTPPPLSEDRIRKMEERIEQLSFALSAALRTPEILQPQRIHPIDPNIPPPQSVSNQTAILAQLGELSIPQRNNAFEDKILRSLDFVLRQLLLSDSRARVDLLSYMPLQRLAALEQSLGNTQRRLAFLEQNQALSHRDRPEGRRPRSTIGAE